MKLISTIEHIPTPKEGSLHLASNLLNIQKHRFPLWFEIILYDFCLANWDRNPTLVNLWYYKKWVLQDFPKHVSTHNTKQREKISNRKRIMIQQVHTLLENRSLYSKSEHLNTISIAVFELLNSSAWTVICPKFFEWVDLMDSSLRRRSNVKDLFDLETICVEY